LIGLIVGIDTDQLLLLLESKMARSVSALLTQKLIPE
jgi:hypothetical protein